ncbi:MAG: Sporulation and spore germination [Nocardioidaceae bacterium]|nr:Sporulation and spore germination [Nocardioidaceae bacterium]
MRRPVVALALGCALLTVLGCSALPESGPVRRDKTDQTAVIGEGPQFSAPGPGKNDSRVEIVNGFLTAMTASPSTTTVARSFLSSKARTSWNPTRSTVIYQAASVDQQDDSVVQARLSDPRRLDARGGWLGRSPAGENRVLLHLVREKGQWRIADPPDALLVPDWFLQQEYQSYELYFFDRTEQVLVPDRVYVPRGEQTVSQLVRGLLAGPGAGVTAIARSEFPIGTELDLSVLLAPNGVAEVPLTPAALQMSPGRLTKASAQLAWTLRQVPGVARVRLTVDDSDVPLPDGRRDFSVTDGQTYAPCGDSSAAQLYALRKGRLVEVTGDRDTVAPGPLGQPGPLLRSVGVSLDGATGTAVTANGRRVLQAPTSAATAKNAAVRQVYVGTDVLAPHADMFGDTWLLDRTASGARVMHVVGGTVLPVDVPGITGRPVKSFLVSRDGSRLAAIVTSGGVGDQVQVADLLRDPDGTLTGTSSASALDAIPSDLRDLRDIAWHGANDLAVLGRGDGETSLVVYASLDGSPGDLEQVQPETYPTAADELAGSPDPTRATYLLSESGVLLRLDDGGSWRSAGVPNGLAAPTYVG